MTAAVLVLSPHLDDAVFSCGGTMALFVDAGWHVCMATAFTRSVMPATGFALACQTDKGLGPDVDYMAVRRAEDDAAATMLGVHDLRWLDLLEAPHRGYGSAAALFGPMRDDDHVWRPLSSAITELVASLSPALILAPQGLGNHVDHRQMLEALTHAAPQAPLAYYRDTPYAIRDQRSLPYGDIGGLKSVTVGIETALDRKVVAACAYGSQVGFQFGGAAAAAAALAEFARAEGSGHAAERFLGHVPLLQR